MYINLNFCTLICVFVIEWRENSSKAFREMTKNPLFKTPHDLKLTLQKFKGCKSLFQLKSWVPAVYLELSNGPDCIWRWVGLNGWRKFNKQQIPQQKPNISTISKCCTKSQIAVQNLKLLYENSNWCMKTQINVLKLKFLIYKNSN